jgi:hypothetical protein
MININMNDFGKFYYSAVSLLQGRNIYDINPAMLISVSALEYGIFLNLNPSHFTIQPLLIAVPQQSRHPAGRGRKRGPRVLWSNRSPNPFSDRS